MSEEQDFGKNPGTGRKPVNFAVDEEERAAFAETKARRPAYFDQGAVELPDESDPFVNPEPDPAFADPERVLAPARGFPFFKLAMSGLALVASLGIGLWTDRLIDDLFSRADWLGYTAIGAVVFAVFAILAYAASEFYGLRSLTNIQNLKNRIRAAVFSRNEREADAAIDALVNHLSHRPEMARGRAALESHRHDAIIDNPGLISLAESELLTPLDAEARALIAGAAGRVSVVTAVSPRALVDIGYVIFEAARLVRALAVLYGGRPGFFGLIRLMRETIAHLAVTGAIAIGDDAIQQLLGHGLASKLSARLGEGVANGLMTARVGIAAMDLCRPMDFREMRRPKVTDFLNVLKSSSRKPG